MECPILFLELDNGPALNRITFLFSNAAKICLLFVFVNKMLKLC